MKSVFGVSTKKKRSITDLFAQGAVGRGSTPKAGLCGFWVSDLLIPGQEESYPWETNIGRPAHYASSLDIMLEGPIGSARFNNEVSIVSLLTEFKENIPLDHDSETSALLFASGSAPTLP